MKNILTKKGAMMIAKKLGLPDEHERNMQAEYSAALALEDAHAEFIPRRPPPVTKHELELFEYTGETLEIRKKM